MQLPIDMPGLGHVNCYALEDERGIAIVDPGLPGEESWRHLVDRLDRSGAGLARVHTVVVTHSHPDHFGGAGRVRKEVGAELITHELFRTWWDPTEDETPLEDAAPNPWRSTPWGGDEYMPDPDRRKRFEEMRNNNLFPAPRPTRKVEDAEIVTLAGREWVSMHTPGHTADHLCLFDPAEGVLLSGDHVLPTITPHINGIGTSEDPLAQFFASLDRMTELEGVTIVLPAHGHPFTDVADRAKAIRRHHEERLDKLRGGVTRDRRVRNRPRALAAPLRAAVVGPDGRQRDLRPPRAPAPARRRRVPLRERQAPLRSGLSPRHHRTRVHGRADDHPHLQPVVAVARVDLHVRSRFDRDAELDLGEHRRTQVASPRQLLLDR